MLNVSDQTQSVYVAAQKSVAKFKAKFQDEIQGQIEKG